MVEVSAAGRVEDTTGVELEAHARSLNGNGDGDELDSLEEVTLIAGLGGLVAGELDSGGAGGLADAITSGVGVVSTSADTTVLEDPLEGEVHETTIAALVTGGARAVNELLLGDGDELVGLVEPSTLDGAGGRESPAGTALALVLHGGDSTTSAPVERLIVLDLDLGEISGHLSAGIVVVGGLETEELGLELLSSVVTELVDGNGVRGTLGVVSEDEVKVGLEGVVLGEEVSNLVLLGVLLDEASEEELVLLLGEGSGGSSSNQDREGDENDLHVCPNEVDKKGKMNKWKK